MVTNVISNGASSFRIKRPLITSNGFDSDVDEIVRQHLDELNAELSRPVFEREMFEQDFSGIPQEEITDIVDPNLVQAVEHRRKQDARSGKSSDKGRRTHLQAQVAEEIASDLSDAVPPPVAAVAAVAAADELIEEVDEQIAQEALFGRQSAAASAPPKLKALLARPLTAKQIPANAWARGSLIHAFRQVPDLADGMTLSDYIDITPELSTLKYAFDNHLSSAWYNLEYNTRAVLEDYPAIRDYLLVWAYHVMGAREINGVKNFILTHRGGAKNVADYAIISGARSLIDSEKLTVPDANSEQSGVVRAIKSKGLKLSSASFQSQVLGVVKNYIRSAREANWIENFERLNNGVIPENIKPQLIQYLRHSPFPLSDENVNFFLPMFITQIMGVPAFPASAVITDTDGEETGGDFEVQYFEQDRSQTQISQSAVKCAAQLYYGMVLGDELKMFDLVNYLMHVDMLSGEIELQDPELLEDLDEYVLSNRFGILKADPRRPGKYIVVRWKERTRPAERQMFYGQVFGYSRTQMTDSMLFNVEFPRLWKVLILESAKYLERAQSSYHPDSYVSRQNVMQAVEDLQYNLSTHCTGMANVITPMIYKEIFFVTKRILEHREIAASVPRGGSWDRVLESLHQKMMRAQGMKATRPKATVIYNKAKLGHSIIRSIADYNPATFEDDRKFSEFISLVDAFITTQSILQDAVTDSLKQYPDQSGEPYGNGYRNGSQNGYRNGHQDGYGGSPRLEMEPAAAAPAGQDEWDF